MNVLHGFWIIPGIPWGERIEVSCNKLWYLWKEREKEGGWAAAAPLQGCTDKVWASSMGVPDGDDPGEESCVKQQQPALAALLCLCLETAHRSMVSVWAQWWGCWPAVLPVACFLKWDLNGAPHGHHRELVCDCNNT